MAGWISSSAQIQHPKASPAALVEQQVGFSKISISYSRPAVRGRLIFGDLVPYGRIWRVGANESTKITVDSDIHIMGNVLAKGTYAIYAFPQKDAWEIVFHTNTTHWGDGRKAYNPKEDAFRIKVKPKSMASLQENFLISFDAIRHNSAQLIFQWEYTEIVIPIVVDTDAQMRKEINQQLKTNPTAQTYYEAARYFQEQGTDTKLALRYLENAINLGGDTYYFHRVKSLVEAAMNNYSDAIRSAKKSLKLAEEEDKDEFVRMNKKNIEEWTKLLEKNKK